MYHCRVSVHGANPTRERRESVINFNLIAAIGDRRLRINALILAAYSHNRDLGISAERMRLLFDAQTDELEEAYQRDRATNNGRDN